MLSKTIPTPRRPIVPPIALALLLMAGFPTAILATPGSKIAAPSAGPARVIGGPSNGCVAGAEALPENGPGYVSVRRYRNRYYGHPELLALLETLGQEQSRRGRDLVLFGDLSQPRGGRMPSSHRSHQNGLDADIWFTLAPNAAAARRLMDGKDDPRSMVAPGGMFMSDAWGEDQRFLLETAARDPSVDRIFVNPAIKRAVCQDARGDRSWLRKLRPWFGHDAHFHVRLRCPAGSPQCRAQAPIPAGDGCGADLAWWFSDEARSPFKKKGKPAPTPAPPAACSDLLRGS